ncbi:MAG: phosphotransferase [Anaerolineae bacterium]|nr:phosphotransferase [Anaerolineae bacterium]
MAKGELIGRGRTADVFAWDDGRALKLFADWMPAGAVQREADLGRKVHETGLPVPAVYGVVEVDGRRGIVYERVEGPTMIGMFGKRPWLGGKLARTLAELQAATHAQKVSGFPSRREYFARRTRATDALSADQKEHILQALHALPDDNALCHGDLHPENVLMTARGPVIIDWIDATQGHPLADVARTWMMLTMSQGTEETPALVLLLIKLFRSLFCRAYMQRYLTLRPEATRAGIEAWLLPVLAARLVENIPGERDMLLAQIAARL